MEAEREASARLGGLDLIRVVAVVAVLLYHADDALRGGLLGVTVFFTLSGFLITGPLWHELRATDRLDLRRFWSKRVRRLVPPSLLTVALIAVVWPILGYELTSGDIAGAVLPVRNWTLLWSDAGYGASPSPTEHFWSLAVEEQIYLVLPVAIWGLWRIGRTRLVVSTLAVVSAGSLGAAIVLAATGSLDRAYLDTSTRLGELVAGALLAVVLTRTASPGARTRRVVGAVGVVALAALAWLFTAVEWPSASVSTWAIPATVVATAAACVAATHRGGMLDRWGSNSFVRLVADRAYELYLVHVPVYLVITTYRTGLTGPALLVARLAATVLLAFGLHLVTEPVRHRRWLAGPRTLAAGLVPVALVLVVAVTVIDRPRLVSDAASANELPALPFVAEAPLAAAPQPGANPLVMVASVTVDRPDATEVASSAEATDDRPSVWLVGDSTLRELEDPERTAVPLSAALDAAGWHVTGFVGVRALALCGERPWDEAGDGQDASMLPAAVDAVADWYSAAPADTVVVQLGSNDLTQFSFDDDELRSCIESFLAALPADTAVSWVVPAFGPWCWCDLDRAHDDSARFADVLTSVAVDQPRLRLLLDGLVGSSAAPREVWAEDGVHATGSGRRLRVDSIVAQLGEAA